MQRLTRIWLSAIFLCCPLAAQEGVQVSLASSFNADPVLRTSGEGFTTPNNTYDVSTNAPCSCYWMITQSAANRLGPDNNPTGVNDNGFYAATGARLYDVQLGFTNATATGTNVSIRLTTTSSGFSFSVKSNNYSQFAIFGSSGTGYSTLTITLHYATGAPVVLTGVTLPDWYSGSGSTAADAAGTYFALTPAMSRVGTPSGSPSPISSEYQAPTGSGAYIYGINLAPDPTRLLTSVDVQVTALRGSGSVTVANFFTAAGAVATVPEAPTIGTATAGSGLANVTFTAPSNTGGIAITGYTVTCGTVTGTGTSSPITVSGLTPGVAVTCTVTATNAVGTSTPSGASNSVTPGATGFTFTGPSGGAVNTASTNFTVTPNASWTGTITITPSGGGLSTPIPLTFSGSAAQTFTITPTAVGPVTLTPANNGSLTNPAALSYNTPPAAPTIGRATAGSASATVTFTAPSSTGGAPITGYTAACGRVTGTGTSSPITVSGLTPGTAVTCTVTATNAAGTSAASGASNSVTPADAPTTTTLTSSPNPSALGQTVTLTATVSPAQATGTVTFQDGSTMLGDAPVTLSNGSAALTVSTLSVAAHSLTAVYNGDANFTVSTSGALTQYVFAQQPIDQWNFNESSGSIANNAVVAVGANGMLTSGAYFGPGGVTGNAVYLPPGESVKFPQPAIFNPGTSDFTILFWLKTAGNGGVNSDNGLNKLAEVLGNRGSEGSASVPYIDFRMAPPTGGLSLEVTDGGNGYVAANTDPTAGAINDGNWHLIAGVRSGVTIRIYIDGVLRATASGGVVANIVNAPHVFAAGANADTSIYILPFNGAMDDLQIYGAALSFPPSAPIGTTTSLLSSANPALAGQQVTLTATVTPDSGNTVPTGTVTFNDGGTPLGSAVSLNGSGVAVMNISSLAAGSHSLTAVYSGDANDSTSTSSTVIQTVQNSSSVVLSSSGNPSTAGQSLTLTATVTPGTGTQTPSGTVTFKDGSTTLGTGTLNGSATATLAVSTLSVGAHTLTAVYGGDTNDTASTSSILTQTVNQAPTTTTLTSSANPSTFGQSVTLTATLTPSTAGGTVTFKEGSTVLGSGPVTLSGGSAKLTISTLSAGAHSLTAVYNGDTNDSTGISTALTQTVNQAPTAITLTSSLNPSLAGQSITLTATVTPSSATGTVTFQDGTAILGSPVALSGGGATLTISTLATGRHSLTASYSGDTNDVASTSYLIGSALNFAAATPATIADSSGQGTGFTTRLPGTGGALAANDPNLTLNTSPGTLTLQSTASNLNGQVSLGTAEFIGFPLSIIGVDADQDFAVNATFRNLQYSQNNDQVGLFAGTDSTTAFRGGATAADGRFAFTTQTTGGADSNLQESSALAPAPGDDVTFTLSRTSGVWAFSIQDLTTPANSGSIPITQPAYLNGLSTLVAGVFAGNPGNATSKTETIGAFSLTVPVQTVVQNTAGIILTSSANPSVSGQPLTLTATVTPSSATGTVTFQDGANILGTGTLTGGTATLTVSTLAFGQHSLTASYGGDANDTSITSSVLIQNIVFPTLWVATQSLPAGQANSNYGPITMQASGGSGNFTWSAAGLPPGITLSASGILSGIPSAAFTGTVAIIVTDTASNLTASIVYTFLLRAGPLTIKGSGKLGSVVAGAAISASFSASGGTPPYTWSLSGAPPGFGVDANGNVSGTAGQAGSFAFSLAVRDSAQATASLGLNFSAFGITTTSLPATSTSANYTATIAAAGGSPPYTFTVSGLPAGLTFTGGTISGKATKGGTYTVAVQASDSTGLSVSATLSLIVAGPLTVTPLQITSSSLPDGTVNQPYSQALTATGGAPGYTWSQSGGVLPAGLSLSSSGTVSGQPTTAGSYSLGVRVNDTSGGQVVATVSINVQPAPLKISNGATLPSGIAGAQYPSQILGATGGVAPYTFSLQGSLPDGLALTDGQIAGTPGTAGNFGFTLIATDSASPPATGTLAMSVTIRPNSPDLVLSAGSAQFSLTSGTSAVPAANAITVSSSVASQVLNFTVDASSAPWLSVGGGGSSTPATLSVGLSNAALALSAAGSPYSGTVIVTCTSGACTGKSQSIGVTLTVTTGPPQLSVSTPLLAFSASAANPQPSSASLGIQNTGGGILGITSVTTSASWISVGAFPSTVPPGPGASVSITANPGSLPGGFYTSSVTVTTSAGSASVPVTLLISANSTMSLGPDGTQFSMPQGGTLGNSSGSFLVSVSSNSGVNFTASVLPGASWLSGGGTGGASSASPGTVNFSLDPVAIAALPAGAYYGAIQVDASGIVNTPQDFQVVLNISPAATPVVPDPEPGGLLFLSSSPGPLPPQTIQVFASSTKPLPFQASASTNDGSGWLSINANGGSSLAGSPAQILVSVDSTGLKPGVYRGGINFASGPAVRTVNVTLVVETPLTAASSPQSISGFKPADSGTVCANAKLAPAPTGLVSNFAAPASWPTPLAVTLVDTCGSIIGNGQIVATFSNGDPPLSLSPVNSAAGLYSGTWTPRTTSSQITITAQAAAPGYPSASVQLAGQVTPNAAPQLAPNGALDVFNPQVGAGLGPGNIVRIYGKNLASQPVSATTLPLPTDVAGTQVLIGGVTAPLFFVSPGQINAQIPFELTAGNQYQVIVSANGALTTPQPIQLNGGAPAILQFTSGLVIAQHQDGTLVSDTSPAAPGDYIVLYMSGLGATDIPVPSGQPSPSSPLANVLNVPVLTLNGNPVNLLFAGLTPGLVGLYQINIQIPAGLADGTYDLVVSQDGVLSNTTSLPVQR